MSDELHQAEEKLRQLGRRVRAGLARLHPPTEPQMTKVREALRQQWEQTHRKQPQQSASRAQSTAHTQTQPKTKSKSQSKPKDQSEDHGHSY